VEKQYGILVNLERCVGCYACEVACQQENSTGTGTPWIRVFTVGPKMVNGKLRMDYIPLISEGCIFPAHGLQPPCVTNCPTQALKVCSPASMLDALEGNVRYQVCTIIETGE
jgi:Fe-S-cluster-containing dehydrogenase component